MASAVSLLQFAACKSPPGLESPRISEHSTEADEQADTMIVKNLPVRCKVEEISASLKDLGFAEDHLIFVNLPSRKGMRKDVNRGYCFVKFRSVALAQRFQAVAQGYHLKSRKSVKGMSVEPARYQGSELASLGETMWFDEASETAEIQTHKSFTQAIDDNFSTNPIFEPSFVQLPDMTILGAGKHMEPHVHMSPAYVPVAIPTMFAHQNFHHAPASIVRLSF